MKKITVLEKYPVYTLDIMKKNTIYKNVDEIFSYLKTEIEAHPIATYIGEFDHYGHTASLEVGEISSKIKNAKNIICCFGKVLPKPEILAVRPRSIGVAEMEDSFVISFMEAPNTDANDTMQTWVEGIVRK